MILSDNFQALLIAGCGGVVAALYKLSNERKKTGSDYDWVDFLLLSVTASFAGVIGFFLASWKFGDPFIILAMTGLASTGGYPMLVSVKEEIFSSVKQKLNTPILGTGERESPYESAYPYQDAYEPIERPEEPPRRSAGRRSGFDRRQG